MKQGCIIFFCPSDPQPLYRHLSPGVRAYIIELKIWHGERYNAEGERQIAEYLDYYGLTTGYMLSFNFNKRKEPGVRQVYIGEKLLYEGVV